MSKHGSLTLDGLSHFFVLGKRSGFRRVPQHLVIADRHELTNALRPFTDARASDLPRLRLFYRRISQSQKLPETGEFAGHLAAALLSAGYCAVKVKKDVGGELPIQAAGNIKPVEAANFLSASSEDKYARVLELVPQHLRGETKEAFLNLATPAAISSIVAMLVLWGGSHFFGVGFAIDVLILSVGFAVAGWSIFTAVGDLIEFFDIMENARSDADLNKAAQKLASAFAELSVGALVAVLTRGAGRIAAAKKASVARKPKGDGTAESRPVPQSAMPKTENRPRRKKQNTQSDEADEVAAKSDQGTERKSEAVKNVKDPRVDYSKIENPPNAGPGKDFTPRQKREALELNKEANGGVVRSDLSGEKLVKPSKSKKGVAPPSNEWQFDHIEPKNKGGTNESSNLQILSRKENRNKSDN